jgi:hypothetical protein
LHTKKKYPCKKKHFNLCLSTNGLKFIQIFLINFYKFGLIEIIEIGYNEVSSLKAYGLSLTNIFLDSSFFTIVHFYITVPQMLFDVIASACLCNSST